MSNSDTVQRIETALPGVYVIQPKIFGDARGFFLESYHEKKYAELGITEHFVQDNHSRSSRGVLRGLHYQLKRPQAKLCRVIEGKALDVVVDVRVGSPTFGKWVSVLLSAEEHNQIFVPKGFAHGFVASSESVQFLYKCSDFHDPADEHGVLWNDPDLKIDWGILDPLLSEKDTRNLPLAHILREFLPVYTPR